MGIQKATPVDFTLTPASYAFVGMPAGECTPEKGAALDAVAAGQDTAKRLPFAGNLPHLDESGELMTFKSLDREMFHDAQPITDLNQEGFQEARAATFAERLAGAKANLKPTEPMTQRVYGDARGITKSALENAISGLKPADFSNERKPVQDMKLRQSIQNLKFRKMIKQRDSLMHTLGSYTFAVTPGKGPLYVNKALSGLAVNTAKFFEGKVASAVAAAPQLEVPANKAGKIAALVFNKVSEVSAKVAARVQGDVREILLPLFGSVLGALRMPNAGRVLADVVSSTVAATVRAVGVIGAAALATVGAVASLAVAAVAGAVSLVVLGAASPFLAMFAAGKFVHDKIKNRQQAREERLAKLDARITAQEEKTASLVDGQAAIFNALNKISRAVSSLKASGEKAESVDLTTQIMNSVTSFFQRLQNPEKSIELALKPADIVM